MLKRLLLTLAALLACAHAQAQTAPAVQLPPGEQCFQATTGVSGMIGTLGTIAGGFGATNGVYVAPLTGGSGTGAIALVTVAGLVVTKVTIQSPGVGYVVGDTLSASPALIGGVRGFSVPVASVSINSSLSGGSVGMYTPNTTTFKQTWKDSAQTILNPNPIPLDQNGCAVIYGSGVYRQILKDRLGNTVWDKPTGTAFGSLAFQNSVPASSNSFTQTGAGAATRTVQAKLQDMASAFDFGALADQSQQSADNDTAAIKALIARQASFAGDGLRVVDLGGRAYAISSPITVPTGIRLTNFKFLAFPSSNWTSTNAVVQTAAGGYNISVDNGYIDCNGAASNGYQNNASGYSGFHDLRIIHFLLKGADIEAPVTGSDSEMSQWTPGDVQFNDQTKRTAYPLWIGPNPANTSSGTDSQFTGLTPYVGLTPAYLTGVHNVRFVNFHPWNGRTDGTPANNPMIMDIEASYNIDIVGGYLDTGYINCNISFFNSCFLSITGSFGFYNSTAATYYQSIYITTQVANSDLHGLRLAGNNWPGGTLSTVLLNTSGAGSWNLSTTAVAAYNGDFDTSRVSTPQMLGSSQSLIQGYDRQSFLTGNSSSAMTLTAPPTLEPPFDMTVTVPYSAPFAVNINTTGNGKINANLTSVNLAAGMTYHLVCYENADGSSAHFSLK